MQRGPTQRTFTEEPEWCWRPTRLECLSHSVPAAEAAREEVVPEVEEDVPEVAAGVLEEQAEQVEAAQAGQVEPVGPEVKAEPGAREEPVGRAARAELEERAAEPPDAAVEPPDAVAAE